MLNIFPDLLTYSFFAPTLLRVAAAGVMFALAYKYYRTRGALAHARFPVIGVAGAWVVWWIIALTGALGAALLVGYYTQIAALVGLAGGLKYTVYRKFYPDLVSVRFPLSQGTLVLFCVICLSLLLTGAGALALDLPL